MSYLIDLIGRVFDFNERVVGVDTSQLGPLKPMDRKTKEWIHAALKEEATELLAADNPIDEIDALVDSMIFAIGGLRRIGLTKRQASLAMTAVLDANDQKAAGRKASRDFGVPDAIKPEGWVAPEERIEEMLREDKRL